MAPPALSGDEVERVARTVLGSADVEVLGALHGYGNQSWRLADAAGKAYVLKVGGLASAPKWRSAHRALELAAAAGVPVPELVHDGELDGHLVRVFTWIDGSLAKTTELDDAQEERFIESLGQTVAALHRIRLDAFSSRLDGSAPAFARWSEYLAYRFGPVRSRCKATGAVPSATLDRVASVLDRLAASIDDVAEPVLCHRDLHPGNLILRPDGTIGGVIDWDMAEPWDRAGDWFKLEYEVLRTRPHRRDDLLAAYLGAAPVPPRWPERRAAVHLIETLNILPNAITESWTDEYATRARHHLETLLTATP